MHTRLFTALIAVFLVVGLTTLTTGALPTVHAEEAPGGGGGGGGSSSGGSSGGGSRGGHGAHRGHSTNATYHVARFLAQHYNIGFGGAFGGTNALPLSKDETAYLCSMQKYLKRLGVAPTRPDIVSYLANLMQRDADTVRVALRSPTLCQ